MMNEWLEGHVYILGSLNARAAGEVLKSKDFWGSLRAYIREMSTSYNGLVIREDRKIRLYCAFMATFIQYI